LDKLLREGKIDKVSILKKLKSGREGAASSSSNAILDIVDVS
jgi:hypothetical protein